MERTIKEVFESMAKNLQDIQRLKGPNARVCFTLEIDGEIVDFILHQGYKHQPTLLTAIIISIRIQNVEGIHPQGVIMMYSDGELSMGIYKDAKYGGETLERVLRVAEECMSEVEEIPHTLH